MLFFALLLSLSSDLWAVDYAATESSKVAASNSKSDVTSFSYLNCDSEAIAESSESSTPENSDKYNKRLASSKRIKACFQKLAEKDGSLAMNKDLFCRLCVQATEDPAFKVESIKQLMSIMGPDNSEGIIAYREGAFVVRDLLHYLPWSGRIKRGTCAIYYRVRLNGLCADFFMDQVFDSERNPVCIPSLTHPSSEAFENDAVCRAEVENAYKALYEEVQHMLATENKS